MSCSPLTALITVRSCWEPLVEVEEVVVVEVVVAAVVAAAVGAILILFRNFAARCLSLLLLS